MHAHHKNPPLCRMQRMARVRRIVWFFLALTVGVLIGLASAAVGTTFLFLMGWL